MSTTMQETCIDAIEMDKNARNLHKEIVRKFIANEYQNYNTFKCIRVQSHNTKLGRCMMYAAHHTADNCDYMYIIMSARVGSYQGTKAS